MWLIINSLAGLRIEYHAQGCSQDLGGGGGAKNFFLRYGNLHARAGDWVGYPIYYCKTQSLGGSFTMHDPNLWAQLNYMVYPDSVGLGTLKYCPPTMGCCLKFEIHLTMGRPSKVKPTP